jgi:hypothetical protein
MTYAAADAGFSDLSHLNKAMHKTLGLSFSKIMGGNKQVLMGRSKSTTRKNKPQAAVALFYAPPKGTLCP